MSVRLFEILVGMRVFPIVNDCMLAYVRKISKEGSLHVVNDYCVCTNAMKKMLN